ncbi:hypothetical protein DFS34DRAFT_599945 [Phlyctochytrium arcticum]|nr:hypothetical protein DFS34DRAFT_599945 [Phlyctochytrium arcticum]
MCANQTELARTVRYLVATVEKAKRAHQLSTRVIVVISRLDVQTPNKDPALLRLLLSTFQTHYPCHLEKLYLFPKTMLLTMGWNVAKVFLNTDIRNRICILGEGEWKDVVRKEVGVQGLGDGFVRGDIAGVEAGEDEEPDSREGSRSDVSKT